MIKFARRALAPARPPVGFVRIFADSDGALQVQDSAGGLTELGAGGGGVTDGDKGALTVAGDAWELNAGVVGTDEMGGDVTAAGKALLTAADAAAQLAALGITGDPWTYIKLGSDFVTSSATAVDITGMAFTPAANLQYEFEAVLLLRTATNTVGPRPGLAWPTGGTDGVGMVDTPTSATARALTNGNINAALLGPVGGLPNTTQSYPSKISGTFIAGASPSGAIKLQLASETGGTNVTAKAGSFLKYRVI